MRHRGWRIAEGLPEVRKVAPWNRNVEGATREAAWPRPAVLVEIGEIEWEGVKGDGLRGRGTVRLHIVTDWAAGGYETPFTLTLRLWRLLTGLKGDGFGGIILKSTRTDHNHEELIENTDEYSVRYTLG